MIKPKEWDWDRVSPRFWDGLLGDTKTRVHKLDEVSWVFTDRILTVDPGNLTPIHPNIRLTLETLTQLDPRSLAEFGVGFGDNLYNAGILLPDAKLYGYDISSHALDHLRQRSSSLARRAHLENCDVAVNTNFTPVDLVFTHVVVMHILGERHMVALRNIFETAQLHVVLMENWDSHSFMDDIVKLHENGALPGWPEMYFYYRYSVEFARPHLMIVSKDETLPYERLYDYEAVLRQPLLKAIREGRP